MRCTRQGAEVRPLRGRSLRRALQVNASVRQAKKCPKGSDVTDPASELLGAWEIMERLDSGRNERPDTDDPKHLWFLPDRIVSGDQWAAWEMPYKARSHQAGGEIDVTRADRWEPWLELGIFEIAGNELRLCMAGSPKGPRPTSFTSSEANGCTLYIARRSQKARPQ